MLMTDIWRHKLSNMASKFDEAISNSKVSEWLWNCVDFLTAIIYINFCEFTLSKLWFVRNTTAYRRPILFLAFKGSAWNEYFASAGHRVRQSALRASHSQFVPVFCMWYSEISLRRTNHKADTLYKAEKVFAPMLELSWQTLLNEPIWTNYVIQ